MTTIGDWLEDLGLGEFTESFVENGVDLTLLPELDNDDLKDMGVTRVADRKTILKAIAVMGVGASAAPGAAAESSLAERRQLSVLFCDLVGSTALSTRLDPEDLRDLLRLYQDTVATVIMRHHGHVADYRGDGILAYFGWPTAHEDQAQNATRAALEAVAAVAELVSPTGEALAAKASIATGQVVVGDLETDTGFQAGAISGETPNRAARLESEAQPGQVLIDTPTRRLLGSAFAVEGLGERAFKGLQSPTAIWLVGSESFAESRFAAQREGRLTPFVARQREVDLIAERIARASGGPGQVIALCGEAGIGKSRLVQRARDLARDSGMTVLQYQCSPSYTSSAYYPFVQQLGHAAGFTGADAPQERLTKLEAIVLAAQRPVPESCAILAEMLQIPAGGRYPSLAMMPELLLREMGSVLLEQLGELSTQRPVLVIIEDLHWADPNSMTLIERLFEALPGERVMLLVTYRPEFDARWQDGGNVLTVQLERLDRDDSTQMALSLAGDVALPRAVLDQILDKTDGVPLFVEELVKTVLESGLSTNGAAGAGPDWVAAVIPSTLQDSLIARLDRLSPVREIAQIGAVIGRDFGYDLIAELMPLAPAQLREGLRHLVEAGLLFTGTDRSGDAYHFKHALVRDAAYDSMLRSRRREVHRAVAEAIERQLPDARMTEPELLAQHYTEAALPLKAIPLWLAAAQTAARRAAYADAIHHADRGLQLLAEVEPVPDLEIALHCARASAILPTNGYADPGVVSAVERIASLSEVVPDSPELVGSLFWVSVALWTSGDVQGATAYCDRILRIADASGSLPLRVAARGYVGSLEVHVPDFGRSREHLEFVLAHYRPEMHEELCRTVGQDLGVNGHSWQGIRLALEGYPVRAMALTHETVNLARRQNHAFSFPLVLLMAGWVAHIVRDRDQARAWVEEGHAYCEATQNLFWLQGCVQQAVLADLLHGNLDCDIAPLEAFLTWTKTHGRRLEEGTTTGALALAYDGAGNPTRAEDLLEEGWRFVVQNPEILGDAYFRFHRAQIFERRERVCEARTDYRAIYEQCGRAGARLLQLRAATRLARLTRDEAGRAMAREQLAPLYDWFTEGHELPDLVDARAALEHLERRP